MPTMLGCMLAGTWAHLAFAQSPATQSRRFLAQSRRQEGEQCGRWGWRVGDFDFGLCADGLHCVAPLVGAPPICQSWKQDGEQCGTWVGLCADGLRCVAPTDLFGAPGICQPLKKQEGEQCGTWGSTGGDFGLCADGLHCVAPTDLVGAPSICHKTCGSFGDDGDKADDTACSQGQTCVGKVAAPCRECLMYCADAADVRQLELRLEGALCGAWGSTGLFNSDCASGLRCVPDASQGLFDVPGHCHKTCGSFGADGDTPDDAACSWGQTCVGRAATPCREWLGECFMYCADASDVQQPDGRQEGEQCGTSASSGHFNGDCASGLDCLLPAVAAEIGASSACHKSCGSFGADGDQPDDALCTEEGQTCVGRASTPCREWAGECLMYCADATDVQQPEGRLEGEQCGRNGSTGYFDGDCASGLQCVQQDDGPGVPNTCRKNDSRRLEIAV